ncbi:unnamed protein product [Orchesella dallaii]|uniref:C2H2-type domain-containing protein n=1 Tax=Orchesella dallaii TaxID=48710 RepID=A0ABP1RHV3_9HEXA
MTSTSTPSSSTCLFCSTPIPVLNEVETIKELEDRSKRIKNLCSQLHLSSATITIPDYCSNVMLPLCGAHEDFLEELWEQEQLIDKAKQEISRKVLDFETTVAHYSYFWGRNEASSSSSSASAAAGGGGANVGSGVEEMEPEASKFQKLRDMIIDGYLKKLMVKRKPWLNPSTNTTPELRVVSKDSEVFDCSDNSSESEVEEEGFVTTENPGLGLHLNGRQVELGYPVGQSNDDDDDDDVHSPLLITDIRGTNVGNVGGNDEVDIEVDLKSNIRVIEGEEVEQEEEEEDEEIETDSNSVRHDDSANNDDNEASTSDETASIGRFHFENVEIFLRRDLNGINYLECSVCNLRFPKPQLTRRGRLSMRMKLVLKSHFQKKHKKKPVAVRIPNNRKRKSARFKSDCQLCKKNSELCLLHKKKAKLETIAGPNGLYFVCDICGRPCKSFLARHKFSHKNDEERRAALAAGEVGAHSAFLATQLRVQCPVCLGSFGGQGPLNMHMKVHDK